MLRATPTCEAVVAYSSNYTYSVCVNCGLNLMIFSHEFDSSGSPVSASTKIEGSVNFTMSKSGSLMSSEIAPTSLKLILILIDVSSACVTLT